MIVTAKQQGFANGKLIEEKEVFEIPDKPRRKLTDDDSPVTKKIADKDKTVPMAFSPSWMIPGRLESQKPRYVQTPEPEDGEAGI